MSPVPPPAERPTCEYYVPCPRGVEQALFQEIRGLGVPEPKLAAGGITFRAERSVAYRAVVELRSAIRVLELLLEGPVRRANDLYDLARRVPWESLLRRDEPGRRLLTIAVKATTRHPDFRDSRYAGLLVKDAVADRARDVFHMRPFVDREDPDLSLRVLVRDGLGRIYRDLAGESLHKRGWRPVQVRSPLNEALAAGLLILSGAANSGPFLDPMCGSGTLVVEAAAMALRRAPGLSRRFAVERWPDFDRALFETVKSNARAQELDEPPFPLAGNDRHAGALDLARQVAKRAGVERAVRFSTKGVATLEPHPAPTVLMVNPPYGVRLGEGADLEQSWRDLGDFLHRLTSGTAYVLSGNPELTRFLRLRSNQRWPFMNGTLSCRLLRYELGGPAHVGADLGALELDDAEEPDADVLDTNDTE